jgi:hypothetical protein
MVYGVWCMVYGCRVQGVYVGVDAGTDAGTGAEADAEADASVGVG